MTVPRCVPILAAWLLSLSPSAPARGQPPARPRPAAGPSRSPEVDDDGRVTFRFRAPNASEVFVARDGAPRAALQKGDDGVWTLTTDPLEPDIYPYSFSVDGTTLADPANPLVKPIVMGGNQSLLHVPGPADLSWEVGPGPRGALHRHFYRSEVAGEDRDYYVYTPPGYDPAADRRYPVLYLLHGITDDAAAWTAAGRAHVILDNLIAQGRAVPMLVVMPLGYAFPDVPRTIFRQFGDPEAQRRGLDGFAATVVDELIPRVEAGYRADPSRDSRAIAGLSMGGAQAIYTGLNHPDRFGWVASFSGAFVMFGDDYADHFPAAPAADSPPLRLLWLACGTDDFLIGPHRKFVGWLEDRGVPARSKETPGGHTWMVWRRYLTDLAPLLFPPPAP